MLKHLHPLRSLLVRPKFSLFIFSAMNRVSKVMMWIFGIILLLSSLILLLNFFIFLISGNTSILTEILPFVLVVLLAFGLCKFLNYISKDLLKYLYDNTLK